MKRIIVAALLSILGCLGHRAIAGDPPKPPELKVLEKFVGTWDCEIVTKPAAWTPSEKREKAVEINEIAWDGWFLHGCSKTPDGKILAILMNTYDPVRKTAPRFQFLGSE